MISDFLWLMIYPFESKSMFDKDTDFFLKIKVFHFRRYKPFPIKLLSRMEAYNTFLGFNSNLSWISTESKKRQVDLIFYLSISIFCARNCSTHSSKFKSIRCARTTNHQTHSPIFEGNMSLSSLGQRP